MKRAAYLVWGLLLLLIVSKYAGRAYGALGGGVRGTLGAVGVIAMVALLYLVGVIISSHLWAGFDRMRRKS